MLTPSKAVSPLVGVNTFQSSISFGRCWHRVLTPSVDTYQSGYHLGRCQHWVSTMGVDTHLKEGLGWGVRHAKCTWSSFCMFYLWLINKYEVHQRKKTTISNLIPEIYFELAVSASCWFGLLVIAHIYIITYCFMVYIFRSDHDLQRQSLKVVNYPIANITRQDSLVVNWDLS